MLRRECLSLEEPVAGEAGGRENGLGLSIAYRIPQHHEDPLRVAGHARQEVPVGGLLSHPVALEGRLGGGAVPGWKPSLFLGY